jgi:hypothetical protein
MNRADIVLARCSKTTDSFGMRFQETPPGHWVLTWAFALSAGAAAREGYDNGAVAGTFAIRSDYPGCPHCGSMSFVLCFGCDKVGCQPVEASWFRCPWCGNQGQITGPITRLSTRGD